MSAEETTIAFKQLFELLKSEAPLPLTNEARFFLMEVSFDVVVGLPNRRGGVPWEKSEALARRDQLLLWLWKGHNDFRKHGAIVVSKLMHKSAERYQQVRWPREKNNLMPPAAEPFTTWWRILRMGVGIPRPKRLQQILQREIQ